MRYAKLGLVGLALTTPSGCEVSPRLVTVPVTGKVTMDGSPVQGAVVEFLNRDPEGRPAVGMTNAEGRFRLRTYLRPNEEPEGAQPGHYDVVITKTPLITQRIKVPRTPDPEMEWQSLVHKDVNLLPEKYSNRGSGLEARVMEGEANEFKFDLDLETPVNQ